MNSIDTKIFIFTLPQEIVINEDEKKLVCNIVIMPKFDPGKPLTTPDSIPFAASDIQLEAFLVKGHAALPELINHDDSYALADVVLQGLNPNRDSLFEKVAGFFSIDDDIRRTPMKAIPVKKYLPESYRKAYGFEGTRQGAVTDDSYFCALKENSFKDFSVEGRNMVNWAQVMSFCLHQPKLANQLGLLYEKIEMALPDGKHYEDGGWVYVDFKEGSSYKDLPANNVQRYGAWIPPGTESRSLFSPVLFPVEDPVAPGTFDDVFDEVLKYSDGFAKIVHASQPVSTNHLGEHPDGTAPVTDMGIRLAWDDEQVLEWYNRGLQSQEKTNSPIDFPAGVSDMPLVVSKYRVDVAELLPDELNMTSSQLEEKLNKRWKSQVSLTADDVKAGDIDLGKVDFEAGISVSFSKHGDKGNYWLPAYFTNWNGTCLSIPDPLPEKLNQLDEIKEQMMNDRGENPGDLPKSIYTQPVEDKQELKYGNSYAFRVRLADISGGGPGPASHSINKGEHKIAVQKFKRYVAPQPPSVAVATDQKSMVIGRPRLNYPAILYADVDTQKAIAELLADRQHLITLRNQENGSRNFRNWLREVSLPDPDVTQVEIVVEIKTLEMDREDSYNAIQKIVPKEPYIFLYKTYRNFPAYKLKHDRSGDDINIKFSYQDISLINFLAPDDALGFGDNIHSKNGPLLLPTARDIRITIRSFCPKEKPDYFGSEESRISISVTQNLRKDQVELEKEDLFKNPEDPLLSIFFLPQPKATPQFREEQKMRGKGNEADSDLLDRLASITGLVNKNGSIIGQENVRTQFGCSAIINHSIAPDHSSVTFSSRDDFYHKWINVIQMDLNRDWSWDLLKPDSFKVFRTWRFEGDVDFQEEDLGGIFLTKGLNWQAMNGPDRSFTRLVFIDALDPKPKSGKFPEPLEVQYSIKPQFKQVNIDGIERDLEFNAAVVMKTLSTVLPITTVPAQVPKIISTGIALSPDSTEEDLFANRYSETAVRNRYLWIQFDKPLADPKDMYFGRVVAYAPDHMLSAIDEELKQIPFDGFRFTDDAKWQQYVKSEQLEPPINLDPEITRVVRPGQPFDQSGLDAMQALIPESVGEDGEILHYLLPLPPGIYPDSEELFGFFSYEFRVGHQDPKKWSTAQGRFGSPLRQTGVQHPAPQMVLNTMRSKDKVIVSTRHAQSFFNGRNLTPIIPRTDIYACLYAQVLQADGIQFRNILIDRMLLLKPFFTTDAEKLTTYHKQKEEKENPDTPFSPPDAPILLPGTPPYAIGFWNLKSIREKLRFLGINENAPLSVLAIELMPRNDFYPGEFNPNRPFIEETSPLQQHDFELNQIRILRTSRLSPVKETCAVES